MLNENEVQLASLAVREIRVAVAHSLLYPFGSPPVRRAIEKAFHCLRELLLLRPRVTLDFEGERPRVEQSDLEEGVVDSTHVLFEILRSHGIRKITFIQGLTADELTSFFALLKPRFLPDEKTALQSIQENPIHNVGVNEWNPPLPAPPTEVKVAEIKNLPVVPTTVVSSPRGPAAITYDVSSPLEVAPETEEDIRYQEAEEAMDRFLEIAGEIDSANHRDELSRRLSGLLNPTTEPAVKAVADSLSDWKEITAEMMAIRDALPAGSRLQQRMDSLLDKWPDAPYVPPAKEAVQASTGSSPEITTADPSTLAENPSQLLNPARESESDAALKSFLDGRQIERIIPAWVVLWNGVFSGAESIQTLCLRHLARLDWTRLPRPLQVEGFTYLDNFLKAHWAENLRLEAMDRLDAWLQLERNAGHWETLLQRAESIRSLVADPSTPPILKTRAMVFLKNLFPRETLEASYKKLGTPGDEQARVILRSAGPMALAFLREHLTTLEPSAVDGPEAGRLALLVGDLESVGEKPLERWLDRLPGEKGAQLLLALALHTPFPKALVEPFREQLAQHSVEVRRQALKLVESSGRKDLYGWAIELLGDADLDIVRRALKVLSVSQMEGVSRVLVAMLESREFPNKESKDAFWVEACQVLGDIADPRSIKPLTDWAQTYNLMEKRKEKSLLVRRAAIQALGRFQRDYVKTFLENLINEGDPALIDVVSEAHEQVVARLEKTPGAPNPAD